MKFFIALLVLTGFSFSSFGAVGPIMGKTSVCVASADTLSDSTAGGAWSSSNVAIATVGSLTGIVTGIVAGTATITYTLGTDYQTKIVVVNPAPLPIYGSTTMCAGNSITLYDTTAGGGLWYYFGDDGLIFIDGSWPNYANISSSSSIYMFDVGTILFIDSAGCSTAVMIWALSPPLPPITGDSIINVDSTTVLTNVVGGGAWRSSDTVVAIIDNVSGVVRGKSPGTTTIYYTYGCTASFTLIVKPPASVPVIFSTKGGSVRVYPNPANAELTIESTDLPIHRVTISNLLGQTVCGQQPTTNCKLLTTDISGLPAGMYIVKINDTEVRKFIKQ